VRKFRDVNTYCSYCYLLAQCWQDVRARIPDPDNTVQRILEEFLAQMRSEAAGCSIREAQAWFSVLHLEPWAGHLGNRQGAITWGSFLGLLSARIDTALRDACQGSGAEALRWLEFLREQACDQTRGWLVKRLAAERLTALPPRLAEAAFQVLESVAAASALERAELLRGVAALGAWQGGALWELSEFREALGACLLDEEERHKKVWGCLQRVLDGALAELQDFERWVDIFLELEKKGLQFNG